MTLDTDFKFLGDIGGGIIAALTGQKPQPPAQQKVSIQTTQNQLPAPSVSRIISPPQQNYQGEFFNQKLLPAPYVSYAPAGYNPSTPTQASIESRIDAFEKQKQDYIKGTDIYNREVNAYNQNKPFAPSDYIGTRPGIKYFGYKEKTLTGQYNKLNAEQKKITSDINKYNEMIDITTSSQSEQAQPVENMGTGQWIVNIPVIGRLGSLIDPKMIGIQSPSLPEALDIWFPAEKSVKTAKDMTIFNIPEYFETREKTSGEHPNSQSTSIFGEQKKGFIEGTYGKIWPSVSNLEYKPNPRSVGHVDPLFTYLYGSNASEKFKPYKETSESNAKKGFDFTRGIITNIRENPEELIADYLMGKATGKIFGALEKTGEIGRAAAAAKTAPGLTQTAAKLYPYINKAEKAAIMGLFSVSTAKDIGQSSPSEAGSKILHTSVFLGGAGFRPQDYLKLNPKITTTPKPSTIETPKSAVEEVFRISEKTPIDRTQSQFKTLDLNPSIFDEVLGNKAPQKIRISEMSVEAKPEPIIPKQGYIERMLGITEKPTTKPSRFDIVASEGSVLNDVFGEKYYKIPGTEKYIPKTTAHKIAVAGGLTAAGVLGYTYAPQILKNIPEKLKKTSYSPWLIPPVTAGILTVGAGTISEFKEETTIKKTLKDFAREAIKRGDPGYPKDMPIADAMAKYARENYRSSSDISYDWYDYINKPSGKPPYEGSGTKLLIEEVIKPVEEIKTPTKQKIVQTTKEKLNLNGILTTGLITPQKGTQKVNSSSKINQNIVFTGGITSGLLSPIPQKIIPSPPPEKPPKITPYSPWVYNISKVKPNEPAIPPFIPSHTKQHHKKTTIKKKKTSHWEIAPAPSALSNLQFIFGNQTTQKTRKKTTKPIYRQPQKSIVLSVLRTKPKPKRISKGEKPKMRKQTKKIHSTMTSSGLFHWRKI
jgi:hypothetical protein